MRSRTTIAAGALLVAGCQPPASPPAERQAEARTQPGIVEPAPGWAFRTEGGDATLVLADDAGRPSIRFICPARQDRLLVNVPAFTPIASEERLTFGSGGTAVALVADSGGDKARGGVTGAGPQPDELKEILIAGAISASYGAQRSGPHVAPPDSLAGPFLSACLEAATAARQAAARPSPTTHPCHVQGDRLVRLSMRALGTEPFWNARIDGRCVTYSTPENQAGTRLWTQVGDGPDGPIFSGTHNGRPFTLVLRPAVGCSDGMSDRRYDWEARLTVEGEERRGCGETLATGP